MGTKSIKVWTHRRACIVFLALSSASLGHVTLVMAPANGMGFPKLCCASSKLPATATETPTGAHSDWRAHMWDKSQEPSRASLSPGVRSFETLVIVHPRDEFHY
jgi:hypothetical protein